jgi:hypothetical protein
MLRASNLAMRIMNIVFKVADLLNILNVFVEDMYNS